MRIDRGREGKLGMGGLAGRVNGWMGGSVGKRGERCAGLEALDWGGDCVQGVPCGFVSRACVFVW